MSLASSPLPQSDQEWHDLAASTLASLQLEISAPASSHEAPAPGTPAFAKTIDHTLLKVDADEEGISKICGEARAYNFKVSMHHAFNVLASCFLLDGDRCAGYCVSVNVAIASKICVQ